MNNLSNYGVLMMNLGTPDGPQASDVRRYLREFLSDKRVVDVNPFIWQPILNLAILPFRSPKVAKVYQQVWMDEGSPLLVLSNRLKTNVKKALSDKAGHSVPVELAMTYGNPSVESAAKSLREQGVKNIVVIPMYPQFSATTTGAAYDRLMISLKKCPHWPSLQLLHDYADHPMYIKALANSVRDQWDKQGERRHLVLSYHGIPKRYVSNGDPYARRCEKTSQLVAEQLELGDHEWTHVYQSRFGREEWLKPYADATLKALPSMGIKKINVISPAFSIDCIETLEEVTLELGDEFKDNGGLAFDYIPALNDTLDQVALYVNLIEKNTQQWS
ncbi:MAG: ferrochelatase [Marinomonas foliarum]|jgi:protoporphyrin/coproporphyrin ferrochelatase|uniref:Ferrochelatase n=1 Tax=Marinomonas foliarum TaxID=491950 RepID=A0A368ZKD7_9GAMM|nr:ferrochelatase [Marinomonas foliarum]QRV24083.1 ferrochelatase [Marinomonas foliarum]RCW94405.1 ferrochelatase [Marinomonas foliarum]